MQTSLKENLESLHVFRLSVTFTRSPSLTHKLTIRFQVSGSIVLVYVQVRHSFHIFPMNIRLMFSESTIIRMLEWEGNRIGNVIK